MTRRFNTSGLKKLGEMWVPLALAIGFVGGMWVGGFLFPKKVGGRATEKINTILSMIEAQYVDAVDRDSLIELTIPELLAHLDPHSIYIPASELQATNEELAGSFSGIGISFQLTTDTITVIEVISGGPAEKVGILAGDRIITIDDSIAAGRQWSTTQVMQHLRGKEGTKVKLGIRRQNSGDKLHDYVVTRGEIPVNSIDANYMLAPGIGYVKVNKFGSQTYAEFFNAVVCLLADGMRNIVIDLRGNGGGFMEPAVFMANEFLPEGAVIVSTKGRLPGNDSTIQADGTGSLKGLQVVVLLDEYSASASEIFAGAIQDNDRGLIIGRRSFGKGLVQNQMMLPDSSALRLTVARYYTPSGRCIQKTYKPGDLDSYNAEILTRYQHGETYSADSIHFDESLIFSTITGRKVYGGGGIMPDVFVPNDTSHVTSWYLNVLNAGLMQKFAFDYTDAHRAALSKARAIDDLLGMLPHDMDLLQQFATYASQSSAKVPQRWGLINISGPAVVNQLKALIARDVLNGAAFYEIFNNDDVAILRAVEEINRGSATPPLRPAKVVEASDVDNPKLQTHNAKARNTSRYSHVQIPPERRGQPKRGRGRV